MNDTEMNEELTVEQAIARMEEIQSIVQKGDVSLNDSVKLLEEATKLYKFCTGKLDQLEERVKILVQGEDGKLTKAPFADME